MAYNSTYTGAQIDESVGKVLSGGIPAGNVTFLDGETFETKFDTGKLNGRDGYLVQDAVVYSEEEQCIGVWTDGKPLYRKTVFTTMSSDSTAANNTIYDLSDLSIDSLIKFESVCKMSDGSIITLPAYMTGSLDYYGVVYVGLNNSVIRERHSVSSLNNAALICTFEYTKTTDAADSGSVVQPYLYEVGETVCGRWIDGKPLYRKAISFGAISTASYSLSVGVANVETILMENCIFNNGRVQLPQANGTNGAVYSGGFFSISAADTVFQFRIDTSNTAITSGVMVIKYTKTTDTATVSIPDATAMEAAYNEGVQSA